jgi:hypothetical protein
LWSFVAISVRLSAGRHDPGRLAQWRDEPPHHPSRGLQHRNRQPLLTGLKIEEFDDWEAEILIWINTRGI